MLKSLPIYGLLSLREMAKYRALKATTDAWLSAERVSTYKDATTKHGRKADCFAPPSFRYATVGTVGKP